MWRFRCTGLPECTRCQADYSSRADSRPGENRMPAPWKEKGKELTLRGEGPECLNQTGWFPSKQKNTLIRNRGLRGVWFFLCGDTPTIWREKHHIILVEQTILHSEASVAQEWVLKRTTPKCLMVLTLLINTVFIDSLLKTKGLGSLKYFNAGSLSDSLWRPFLNFQLYFIKI